MKTIINLFICILLSLYSEAQITVTLKGKVVGRDSKSIIIIPITTSIRSENKPTIEIVNNQFEYTFTTNDVEAYEMVFEDEYKAGAWSSIIVFPDTSIIELLLNSQENFSNNIINGGKINRDYYAYNTLEKEHYKDKRNELSYAQRVLYDNKNYFTKERDSLTASLGKSNPTESGLIKQHLLTLRKTGKDMTPEGTKLISRLDSLNRAIYKWRYAMIKKTISINNYYLMLVDVQYRAKGNAYLTMLIDDVFKAYAVRFPDHIYTKTIGEALSGIVKIFPGNQFVDFIAPDLEGQDVRLSEVIRGKVALINLWGSWCAPCILKSQQIVPIYKRYKNNGFIVVGVAREFKNTSALLSRLKKEEFSWLNLVELDDKAGIWNKYSISNGAGVQVLVDAGGKILAVDPTAEEVEQVLKNLIKSH